MFFEDIITNINNYEYNKAYDTIYDELYINQRLRNCHEYEVLSRYLLALLSDCLFEDNNVINGDYTFAEFQIKEIKELLDSGAIDKDDYEKMKREIIG